MKNEKDIDKLMGSNKKNINTDNFFKGFHNQKLSEFSFINDKKSNNKNKIQELIPDFKMSGFKNIMMNTEGKARKHSIKNPEAIANKRLAQQIGLSPMGDFDNDKVINMLDCNPRNINEQGLLHKLKNFVSTGQFIENLPIETPVGKLEAFGQPVEQKQPLFGRKDNTNVQQIVQQQPQVAFSTIIDTEGVKQQDVSKPGVAARLWESTSLPGTKTFQTKQELGLSEQRARIKAFREGGADILKQEQEMEKLKLMAALKARAGVSQQAPPPGVVARRIDTIQRGTRQVLSDVSQGTRQALPDNTDNIRNLIGWRTGPGYYTMLQSGVGQSGTGFRMAEPVSTGEGFYRMIGQEPPQVQQIPTQISTQIPTQVSRQVPTQVPTQVSPQVQQVPTQIPRQVPAQQISRPDAPSRVWSAKSKRYVKYTRPSYRKGQAAQ